MSEVDSKPTDDITGEIAFFKRKSHFQCFFLNYLFQIFISIYCLFRWQGCLPACCVGTMSWFVDYFNWWRSCEARKCLCQIHPPTASLQKTFLILCFLYRYSGEAYSQTWRPHKPVLVWDIFKWYSLNCCFQMNNILLNDCIILYIIKDWFLKYFNVKFVYIY